MGVPRGERDEAGPGMARVAVGASETPGRQPRRGAVLVCRVGALAFAARCGDPGRRRRPLPVGSRAVDGAVPSASPCSAACGSRSLPLLSSLCSLPRLRECGAVFAKLRAPRP